jgi:hypothetical protein
VSIGRLKIPVGRGLSNPPNPCTRVSESCIHVVSLCPCLLRFPQRILKSSVYVTCRMSQWEQAIQPSDLCSSVNNVSRGYMLIPKVGAVSPLSQLTAKCHLQVRSADPPQSTTEQFGAGMVHGCGRFGSFTTAKLPFPPPSVSTQQRGTQPPLPVAGLRWSPQLTAIAAP